MNLVSLSGVAAGYAGGEPVLQDIDLTIEKGEFVLLAGANGSGKTTLIRLLNGLVSPRRGVVRVDGRPVRENLAETRRKVGVVFQDADAQIVGQSVAEDAAFGPENLGLPRSEVAARVAAALEKVGLSTLADRPVHTLSGGEKKRLAIAGVLAMDPAILVMDEPFANLDYPGVRDVLRHILSLHREGHTILVASHDIEKTVAHADRLVLLAGGRICLAGRPAGLLDRVEEHGVRAPCSVKAGVPLLSWLS